MKNFSWMAFSIAAAAFALGCGDDTEAGGNGAGAANTGGTPAAGGNGGAPGTGGTPEGGAPSNGGGPEGGGPEGGGGGTGGSPGVPTAAECTETCEEAVAGKCAPFDDCKGCCAAAVTVTDCNDAFAAYYECLNAAPTPCRSDCTAEQEATVDCLTDYCLAHITEPVCGTLIGCQP